MKKFVAPLVVTLLLPSVPLHAQGLLQDIENALPGAIDLEQ